MWQQDRVVCGAVVELAYVEGSGRKVHVLPEILVSGLGARPHAKGLEQQSKRRTQSAFVRLMGLTGRRSLARSTDTAKQPRGQCGVFRADARRCTGLRSDTGSAPG
jgi:hypothetical protein